MKGKKKVIIKEDDDLPLKKIIGQRIKTARDRQNHQSAQTIAEKIGISRSALTQIETGRNNISAVLLWKIAGILHCEIQDLFPEVPDSKSLAKSDFERIAKENKEAAMFMKKAFKSK